MVFECGIERTTCLSNKTNTQWTSRSSNHHLKHSVKPVELSKKWGNTTGMQAKLETLARHSVKQVPSFEWRGSHYGEDQRCGQASVSVMAVALIMLTETRSFLVPRAPAPPAALVTGAVVRDDKWTWEWSKVSQEASTCVGQPGSVVETPHWIFTHTVRICLLVYDRFSLYDNFLSLFFIVL